MLKQLATGIGPIAIVITSATAVLALVILVLVKVFRRRRSTNLRRQLIEPGFPLIVGRTTLCSLCDTEFKPPLSTREWAKCPTCKALVRV